MDLTGVESGVRVRLATLRPRHQPLHSEPDCWCDGNFRPEGLKGIQPEVSLGLRLDTALQQQRFCRQAPQLLNSHFAYVAVPSLALMLRSMPFRRSQQQVCG